MQIMSEYLQEFQKRLGYAFKNEALLVRALSHSSYVNEKQDGSESNERLEFLGDSVLGFITADLFFDSYAHLPEGELTKYRAAAVCEKSLSVFARELDIGGVLHLGKGEERTGGRNRPSILADAFEAVLAAVYLDGGIGEARKLAVRFVGREEIIPSVTDYKTRLQEIVQKNPEELLEYIVVNESGPDHNKTFEVEVHLNSNVIGRGTGRSKKIAEQEAARETLALMGV